MGYKLEFKTLRPHHFLLLIHPKVTQGQLGLQNFLNQLLSYGVVVLVLPQDGFKGFFSNLFTVPKTNRDIGDIHLDQDSKSPNQFLQIFAWNLQRKYMTSINIQDAYLDVSIYQPH